MIASNYGQSSHPAWYYNLRADPTGEVAVDGDSRPSAPSRRAAPSASGSGRRGCRYPGWSQYERRASDRRIAIFVLTPP